MSPRAPGARARGGSACMLHIHVTQAVPATCQACSPWYAIGTTARRLGGLCPNCAGRRSPHPRLEPTPLPPRRCCSDIPLKAARCKFCCAAVPPQVALTATSRTLSGEPDLEKGLGKGEGAWRPSAAAAAAAAGEEEEGGPHEVWRKAEPAAKPKAEQPKAESSKP